jgi:dihydroxy-acid dehydratase
MAPNFCENCTCGRDQAGVLATEGSTELARREERSFTAPSDWIEPTEGIEPAVPLRSKLWFNNPEDCQFFLAVLC